MLENRSSLFGLIAIIIGAAGLGVGAYSVVNFQVVEGPQGPPGQDGDDGPPGSLGILVGLWEELYRNMSYAPYNLVSDWLIEVDDVQIYDNEYLFLNRSNTRFHLTKIGWYCVNINAILVRSGVSVIEILKDGIILHRSFRGEGNPYTHVTAQFYISSNGTNYYEFYVWAGGDIQMWSDQSYNQLAIEYLGEY